MATEKKYIITGKRLDAIKAEIKALIVDCYENNPDYSVTIPRLKWVLSLLEGEKP